MADLRAIRERLENIKDGPWEWEADGDMVCLGTKGDAFFYGYVLTLARICPACQESGKRCLMPTKEHSEFIAHARQDIPDLLEEVAKLEVALMDMVNKHFLHAPTVTEEDNPPAWICHSFMAADERAIGLLIDLGLAKIISEKPLRFELLWKELGEKGALLLEIP